MEKAVSNFRSKKMFPNYQCIKVLQLVNVRKYDVAEQVLALREKHGLREFENGNPRRKFGPKMGSG